MPCARGFFVQSVVDLDEPLVEVHTPLPLDVCLRVVKQVHEEGLAGAATAPDVEAVRGRVLAELITWVGCGR